MNNQDSETKVLSIKSKLIRKYLIRTAIVVIALIFVSGALTIGYKRFISSESKTTKIGFENIGELATQSANCTEINVTDSSRKMFGVKIPFTQSKYIYSYDVVIKAGYDFGDIKWNKDDTAKTIEIKLPKAKILSSELKLDSFKVYHEAESVFNQIRMEENNDALKTLNQTAEDNAIANGLFENARANAETILTSFFGNVYDLKVYKISFTDK